MNARLRRSLPGNDYAIFHDVTLDSSHGPTQIDHIVLSRFGVFVIETKNYKGWIFGSETAAQWTQTIYRKKSRFQNPLRQNYKHTKAVEGYFSVESDLVHSVVVFVGRSRFKTKLPANVTQLRGLVPYMRTKREQLLTAKEVAEMTSRLTQYQTSEEPLTRERTAPQLQPSCPKCTKEMALRTAKKGRNIGQEFWGCTDFPNCRGIRKVATSGRKRG